MLLPLAALGLLATIFMLSHQREAALDLTAYLKVSDGSALQTGIGQPTFSGDTDQGDRVIIRADRAMPDGDGVIAAEQVRADVALNTGGEISMTARRGDFLDGENRLDLSGGVEVTTSNGYVVQTDAVQIRIDHVSGQTTSHVQAHGPVGQLRADRMEVTQDQATGDVQMHFTGNVKLIYLPQQD